MKPRLNRGRSVEGYRYGYSLETTSSTSCDNRSAADSLLPAPADDCFLFADLTARGRREDLVVKGRYWNMWGITYQGSVIWHWKGCTGHFPAIADVDTDGKDEVFVGFALIDDDGEVVFETDPKGAHQVS